MFTRAFNHIAALALSMRAWIARDLHGSGSGALIAIGHLTQFQGVVPLESCYVAQFERVKNYEDESVVRFFFVTPGLQPGTAGPSDMCTGYTGILRCQLAAVCACDRL